MGQIEKEYQWLPTLAPHLPFVIPKQVAIGAPMEGYPWPWAVYEWLEGQSATFDTLLNPGQAARDMAHFLRTL